MIDLQLHKALLSNTGAMHFEIDLKVPNESFLAIQGKSGAGKTSLLRMIAGLMPPDSGRIEVHDSIWYDSGEQIDLQIQNRHVGYVFQDYALFPNMTVQQNLEFALPKGNTKDIIDDLIALMELGELRSLKPEILSGGQKQRVALARALVQRPSMLLLDEPLSALDHEIRTKLQSHILSLHKEFKLTTLMVTHDHAETLRLADDLIVLEGGKVLKKGRPSDILATGSVEGKFQFSGEIIAIQVEGESSILSVLVGKELVSVTSQVIASKSLSIGDRVSVSTEAINPVVQKIN